MIKCSSCQQFKKQECFSKNRSKKTGYQDCCKPCTKIIAHKSHQKHKEKTKLKRLEYLKNGGTEKVRNQMAKWRKNNPTKVKLANKRDHETGMTKIEYRLTKSIRARLHNFLKGKDKSARKLLGCDLNFLKDYLAMKFIEGMSWDNYGDWEIDHIFPLSKVDFSNEHEIAKVCHYTNLQPLWAYDNIKKYNKVLE